MGSTKYVVTRVKSKDRYKYKDSVPITDILELLDIGVYTSRGTVIYEKNGYNIVRRTPFTYESSITGNGVFTIISNDLSYTVHKTSNCFNVTYRGIGSIIEDMLKVVYTPTQTPQNVFNQLPEPSETQGLIDYMWYVVHSIGVIFTFKNISIDSYCELDNNVILPIYTLLHLVKMRYFKITI